MQLAGRENKLLGLTMINMSILISIKQLKPLCAALRFLIIIIRSRSHAVLAI